MKSGIELIKETEFIISEERKFYKKLTEILNRRFSQKLKFSDKDSWESLEKKYNGLEANKREIILSIDCDADETSVTALFSSFYYLYIQFIRELDNDSKNLDEDNKDKLNYFLSDINSSKIIVKFT